MKKRVVLLTLLAVMVACFGCASSRKFPVQYPIIEPLDPVTNQEIQYVR
jgi:hypothetical protein